MHPRLLIAAKSAMAALVGLAAWGCGPHGQAGTAGANPRLAARTVDLGELPHGRRGYATFVLENPEDKELAVRGVVVSCACAYLHLRVGSAAGRWREVEPGPRPEGELLARVEPGGRLEATVRYETAEINAIKTTLNEPVTFFLDHPRVPRLDGRLAGSVHPRLIVQPPIQEFRKFPASSAASLLVDLLPLPGAPPFKVLGLKGLQGLFRGEILFQEPGRIRLRFTAGPGLAPGALLIPVHVKTDLDQDYELPLMLKGLVVPDLQLEPLPPLPFGPLAPRQTGRTSCLLTWHLPQRNLAPRVIGLEGPSQVSARLVELEPGSLWRLELVCEPGPEGLPPGLLRGHVLLATEDPEHRELRVPFNGNVEPAR